MTAIAAVALPVGASDAASLYAAGNNSLGQLGNGTTANSSTLVPVAGMNYGVTSLGAGFVSLSVKGGGLYGWGYTAYGSLGNGVASNTPTLTPQPSTVLSSGVTSVAAGQIVSVAIANGALYSFGTNSNGALANGTPLNTTNAAPQVVTGLSNGVTAVSAGQQHVLAVKDGGLYTWGYAARGALGNGTSGGSAANVTVATPVSGFDAGVTLVAGGSNHSLVVRNNVVYGFGDNRQGAVGNDGTTEPTDPAVNVNRPAAVVGLPAGTVSDLAAGGSAAGDWSMALVNGSVYAWGYNGNGQLGNGTTTQQTHAVAVTGISGSIVDIAAGASSAYALAADGSLWSWGNNADGRLALGSTAAQFNTPQRLLAPAGYRFSAIGAETVAAHVLVAQSALPVYFNGQDGNVLTDVANYSTTVAGSTAAPIAPVESTDIYFGTANAAVASLNASTGAGLVANSLTFGTGMSATNAVTIGGSGTITLYADKNVYAAGTGIVVQSGSAAVTINAPLVVGASQSWSNASATPLAVNGGVGLGSSSLTITGTNGTTINGVVSGSGALVVTAGGVTTLSAANTYSGGTTVSNANAVVRVAPAAGTVLLSGAGTNLAAGRIAFENADAATLATVRSLLTSGYGTGFNAGVLRSTTATAGRGLGYKLDGTTVTVMATLYGDATLDGSVDFNDFLVLQNNFNKADTRFDQGNFNYDGLTDFNDFLVLQNNFGKSVNGSGVAFTAEQVAAITAFASSVPEPTLTALVGLGALAGVRRTRRVTK